MTFRYRHLVLLICFPLAGCFPTLYLKVPESSADADVVRIPRGQARQVQILSIDDHQFDGINNDFIIIAPGRHEFRFTAPGFTELEAKLTRVVEAGSVIQLCPGLNRETYGDSSLSPDQRWSPFIRTIDVTSISESMSMINLNHCLWAYRADIKNVLE